MSPSPGAASAVACKPCGAGRFANALVTRISLSVFPSAQFCANFVAPRISLEFIAGACVAQPQSNRFMMFPSCTSAALSCADASCVTDCTLLSWPLVAEALAESQCKPWNPDNAPVAADQSFFAMSCSAPSALAQSSIRR